jgi:hypothetical protein
MAMAIALEAQYRLTVFAGGQESSLVCQPQLRAGRRLIALLSGAAPQGALVKIHCGDSLLFGEVCACWQDAGTIHAVIELNEVLAGLSELADRYGWAQRATTNDADVKAAHAGAISPLKAAAK